MLYDILPPLFLFASFGGIILVVSRVILRMRRQQLSQHIQAQATLGTPVSDDKVFAPGKRGIKLVRNRLALTSQTLKSSAERTKEAVKEKKGSFRTRLTARRQEKKEAKIAPAPAAVPAPEKSGRAITMPKTSWRDRLANVANKSKERVSSLRRRQAAEEEAVPVASPQKEAAAPVPTFFKASSTKSKIELVKKAPQKKEKKVTAQSKAKESVPAPVESKPELTKRARTNLISRVMSREELPASTPLREAVTALEAADYSRVEDILIPYIVQHTKDTHAYILLGQAAMGKELWEEAVEVFQQVLKINPNQKGVYAALGSAALQGGKMTLALQSLQRANDEDPENKEVLRQLLVIAQRMDNKPLQHSVSEQLEEVDLAPTRQQAQV